MEMLPLRPPSAEDLVPLELDSSSDPQAATPSASTAADETASALVDFTVDPLLRLVA